MIQERKKKSSLKIFISARRKDVPRTQSKVEDSQGFPSGFTMLFPHLQGLLWNNWADVSRKHHGGSVHFRNTPRSLEGKPTLGMQGGAENLQTSKGAGPGYGLPPSRFYPTRRANSWGPRPQKHNGSQPPARQELTCKDLFSFYRKI